MSKKIHFFVFFFAIFCTTNKINAQVAKCDYSYEYHVTRGYIATNSYYYACGLNTRLSDFNEKITRIDGEHIKGHFDSDVKFIGNHRNSNLKIFSSVFCKKFPDLKVIKMSLAEVESIDEDSLSGCENLEHMTLHGNKLREVPEKLLNKNLKLTKFWLGNNQLTTVPEKFFENQQELGELDLNGNQIDFLPTNIFRPLAKIGGIDLHNNRIQSINTELFKDLHTLKLFALDVNQITEVPSKAFVTLKNLEKLFLYENKIQTLHSDSFEGLENLQVLRMQANEISDLPAGVFAPLKNLQELHLWSNRLTTIHSKSFSVHKRLFHLEIQNNKIFSIDEKFIDNTTIANLDMRNNICAQFITSNKTEIKPNLKRCFENYNPRAQIQLPPLDGVLNPNSTGACGKPITGQGNIIGGKHIARGSFPWIAALVLTNGQYFCGGALVTNRKVVSAAHCIQDKHTTTPKSAGEFAVLLGVHDLKKQIEIGRFPYAVQKITLHPDWNPLAEAFDADISVLVLEREVTFNEHIQPICLTIPNSYAAALRTGVVVGYGRSEDETKTHENIPKVIETPIHRNEECFLQNYRLVRLSSQRTFCGGTGTGIGVCRGDSGGGLFVSDGNAFYLRGVVSSSVIGGPHGCDVDTFSVFTDVTKYIDWINGISTSRFKLSFVTLFN